MQNKAVEKRKERRRLRYASDKKFRESKKRYYAENREKIISEMSKRYKSKKKDTKAYNASPRGKMVTYKNSAKKRKLPFELTLSDFERFQKAPCNYCHRALGKIGIDRVDNALGYTVANTVPCCSECNLMKRSFTKEFFIEHCKRIAANH